MGGTRTLVLYSFSRGGRERAWEVRGPGARSDRLAVLVSPKGDGSCTYRSWAQGTLLGQGPSRCLSSAHVMGVGLGAYDLCDPEQGMVNV